MATPLLIELLQWRSNLSQIEAELAVVIVARQAKEQMRLGAKED